MNASFEEKSVWIQLFATLLTFGAYFAIAGIMLSNGITALPAYAPLFAAVVVLMVIVLIAGHIVAAIASRPRGRQRDERDRLIEWRAESNSSWVVAAGVLTGVTCMVISIEPVWVAHLLLLSLVLSEILKYAFQILYYRRGV